MREGYFAERWRPAGIARAGVPPAGAPCDISPVHLGIPGDPTARWRDGVARVLAGWRRSAARPSQPYQEVACIEQPADLAELDEEGYFTLNPDVAASGLSAADHYTRYGRHEHRKQAINVERVIALRRRKLERVRFRRPPPARRDDGMVSFLTPELAAEFQIPAYPPVSAHVYGDSFQQMLRDHPDYLFLDVGAGLRWSVTSNMVNMDIFPTLSTDVVCVGEDLPFASDQFDIVLCAAVLEHTRRPWEVAREICRVTKPGGTIRIDWPFISQVHGYPNHFFNATPEGAISLFQRDCVIHSSTVEANNHPIHALWWLLEAWQSGLEGADRARFEGLTVGEILARPPEAQLEAAYCRNLGAATQRVIPAGSTLVAVKKPLPR